MARKISNRSKRREIERNYKNKPNQLENNSELLHRVRYSLNPTQIIKILDSIDKNTLDFIEGHPLPKSYSEIRKTNAFKRNNLTKELIWSKIMILKYSEEINLFLELEKKFESNLLLNNFNAATDLLDKIEHEICYSYWSIEKRLLLAELEKGFKGNKEVLSSILSDSNNALTNILAGFYSIRVEQDISYSKYVQMLNEYINQYDDNELREYLRVRLDIYSENKINFHGFILNFENNNSIIDRYLLFRHLLTLIPCTISQYEIDRNLAGICNELLQKINDPVLKNLAWSLGCEVDFILNEENISFINCLDDYSKGNYQECIAKSRKLLALNPNYLELYTIYCKSLIFSHKSFDNLFDPQCEAGKILSSLFHIIQKDELTTSSLVTLYKVFNSNGISEWGYKCFSLFNNEHSISDPNYNYKKYALINSSYFNPIISTAFLNKENSVSYLEKIKIACPKSLTVAFWLKINQKLIDEKDYESIMIAEIPEIRGEFYRAKLLQTKQNYSEAVICFKNILEDYSNDIFPHQRLDIIHGILNCNLAEKKHIESCRLIGQEVISNPNFKSKLTYNVLINEILNGENSNLHKEIFSPILLHLYDAPTNEIWIALDNFLCAHNLTFPHEVISLDFFGKTELVYFLKHIAKQEIYESSYHFSNQDSLDNERIEICLELVNIDSENAKEYRNEISEISRNLLIRQGIKQIDESKIYVDVVGVKESLNKDLEESFSRSINMLNLPLAQIDKLDQSTDSVIVPYFGKDSETSKIEFNDENINVTSYSRFKLFADMFYKIRDKFIASNEFGIDTYLSMRIRHGTLLGETRSVFENHHLITKKESTSGTYHKNQHWIDQLHLNGDIAEKFNNIMSDFSHQIDSLSDELKNKWLQVRTEKKKSEGLFDYSYDESNLLRLFTSKFGAIDTYSDFFDSVIEELWNRTESNLSVIREYVSKDVKSKNINLLMNLSSDLEQLVDRSKILKINEIITSCQTSISTEFDKISLWFRRTNNKSINEFDLNLPVDASLVTLRRIYPEYAGLNPKIDILASIKFEGEYFTQFTFLIQNLFENIIKHSELKSDDLNVKFKAEELNDQLIIQIENNVSNSISIAERNLKIAKTRDLVSKEIGELIRSESGTGYIKIKKILLIDFKRLNYTIEISDVDENLKFSTRIVFELNGLQKEKNEVSNN